MKVILVCRISKESQDERSLNDQENLLRQWLRDHYDGPTDVLVIAGQGSGESLLRDEAVQLEEAVAAGGVDLVLAEDLGRVYRRLHALIFCETCEDVGTRIIALNDGLDTAHDDWRMCGMFAAMRHEAYNKDTAKRIRRTLRNRFEQGGVIQTHIYGYIKPPGTKHDSELQKDPAAEPIYDYWFKILEDGGTYSDVADWLNEQRIPLGPWCRSSEWTCRMVGRITRNPLLKGVRERNRRMAKRVNKSGRHKSIAAPPGELLKRHCPHLAFIDAERYDRLIRKLSVQNAWCRRKLVDGADPRQGISKKRTRWPGQHLTCGVCGGLLVYGAHGQKEHLMCTASREYRCWMTVSVDGPLARKKLTQAIWSSLESLAEFDEEMRAALASEAALQGREADQSRQNFDRREAELRRQEQNLGRALRELGPTELIAQELERVGKEKEALECERDRLSGAMPSTSELPTLHDLRREWQIIINNLAGDSQEVGRLLRKMIPKIEVEPYQLLDGGNPVLRARLTLDLAAGCPTQLPRSDLLRRELVVDLFDPPQREKFRPDVIRLRATGMTVKQIASQLDITKTAAQRCVTLQRMMDVVGITDPYRRLTEPPAESRRFRRHKHKRFHQQPPNERPAA